MAPEKDGAAPDKTDKGNDKAEPKPGDTKPRQLNRQELESLRRQLQKKFHRS